MDKRRTGPAQPAAGAPIPQSQSSGSVPAVAPVPGSSRVSELVDQLKTEVDVLEADAQMYRKQRDELQALLDAHLSEFTGIQSAVLDLERRHTTLKQQYEEEITRLRRQLEAHGCASVVADGAPAAKRSRPDEHSASSSNPTPSIISSASPSGSNGFSAAAVGFPKLQPLGGMNAEPKRDLTFPNGPAVPNLPSAPDSLHSSPMKLSAAPPSSSSSYPSIHSLDSRVPNSSASPISILNVLPSSASSPSSASAVAPISAPPLPSIAPISSEFPNSLSSLPFHPSSSSSSIDASPSPLGPPALPPSASPAIPPNANKEDWIVVYNTSVKTNININLLHTLDHDRHVVCCVNFSRDGKYLVTGSNKLAQMFETQTGALVSCFSDESSSSAASSSSAPANSEDSSYVRSVVVSPNGQYLAAGAEDRIVKVWEVKGSPTIPKLNFVGHTADIYSLDFSPDGKLLVSGSGDSSTRIWNMDSAECVMQLGKEDTGPWDGVTSVAISPDGRYVASGSLDCYVRLWDLATGRLVESFEGHKDSVYSVAFSPDGSTLASGSLDQTLKLWDVGRSAPSRKNIASLVGHKDYVLSVAFSPDGRWLVSGSKDRSVQFWDPRSYAVHLMLQGHKNSVISVAMNPTAPLFATGSGDFRARLWEFKPSFTTGK